MKKYFILLFFICFHNLSAQEGEVTVARDGFLSIATDARAAGQGDVGVATSPDAFSQSWNPSKYVFSNKKFEIGVTQILANREELNQFSQFSMTFYNRLNNRSAYALSFRNYMYTNNQFAEFGTVQTTHEGSIDGSYTLKLSEVFAMSVGGRLI